MSRKKAEDDEDGKRKRMKGSAEGGRNKKHCTNQEALMPSAHYLVHCVAEKILACSAQISYQDDVALTCYIRKHHSLFVLSCLERRI